MCRSVLSNFIELWSSESRLLLARIVAKNSLALHLTASCSCTRNGSHQTTRAEAYGMSVQSTLWEPIW